MAAGLTLLMPRLGSACQNILWSWKDPSSLAVTRILFGVLMMMDILHERGFAEADHRFGDPKRCHFPLFTWLKPLAFQWMCLLYLFMWLGALGVTLGYRFKLSCLCFLVPYWYIFFLDKTAWNNHSYLYGLLSLLLFTSSANHCWSVDGWLNPELKNAAVPGWNYAMLRFQIFLLYFYAGVKKLDPEWLGGHSMKRYGGHWVFAPFRTFLDEEAVEYFVVHLGGFILDLTVGFWLIWPRSRAIAMVFTASFHLMNSQLFSIGMFPYVCLATLPIFCNEDWPKRLLNRSAVQELKVPRTKSDTGRGFKAGLMALYVLVQLTLPWSHSITLGYNNWTNGLYGYSWDMMVHAWDTMHVVVTVRHKSTGRIDYLDTEAFVRNDKWVGHADMIHQYVHCVADRLAEADVRDVAIHVDVWRSLNGRFQQRMVDPRVDLLQADWSPFKPTEWIMPLLAQLTPWREELDRIEKRVHEQEGSSSAASVVFVADFPGLAMENYVPDTSSSGVTEAWLQVLDGTVELSGEDGSIPDRLFLSANESVRLPLGAMHSVLTTSDRPACYMYTYYRKPDYAGSPDATRSHQESNSTSTQWLLPFTKSAALVAQSLLSLVFGVPLVPARTNGNGGD